MIGHLIYSYQHLDDARIQQEISRKLYAPAFGGVHTVHVHNQHPSFPCRKYLEDVFIEQKNRGHFQGACDAINRGIAYFQTKGPKAIHYVIVTAADTWCINVRFLKKLLNEMERNAKVIAASSWSKTQYPVPIRGFSTDFFIIDIRWIRQTRVFPLHFNQFKQKFKDLFTVLWQMPNLEMAFQYQYSAYFMNTYHDNDIWITRDKLLERITEREPIHRPNGTRINDWPTIGLYTNPEPTTKRRALINNKLMLGPHAKKLIQTNKPNYYNH
ncbi:MAG: hypothetical protein PHY34_01105 [Patescibacteria group bacterium]|nr:hypothetical protein [Patescibacteria group bacterium]MDD5715183.1 hypothetical protein [Patescibacteria group bacterium]